MTNPKLYEYGLLAWLKRERTLSYTGYARIGVDPQEIHLLVIRWLLWWGRYADYTEMRKGHEWNHCDRKDAEHDPAPGDVMSTSVWNATTDKQNVMARSAEWRASQSRSNLAP